MARVEIVKARPRHIVELIDNLRAEDLEEIRLMKLSPATAVWGSYRLSTYNRAILVEGKVAVIGGLSGSPIGGKAELWLFSTSEAEKIPLAYFKLALAEKHKALKTFDYLEGWVSARYERAIEFLTRLGFEVTPGSLFCRFVARQ